MICNCSCGCKKETEGFSVDGKPVCIDCLFDCKDYQVTPDTITQFAKDLRYEKHDADNKHR